MTVMKQHVAFGLMPAGSASTYLREFALRNRPPDLISIRIHRVLLLFCLTREHPGVAQFVEMTQLPIGDVHLCPK